MGQGQAKPQALLLGCVVRVEDLPHFLPAKAASRVRNRNFCPLFTLSLNRESDGTPAGDRFHGVFDNIENRLLDLVKIYQYH